MGNDVKEGAQTGKQDVVISAPNIKTVEFDVVGTAPYVQLRFSEKAKATMAAKHQQGSQAKKGKQREARSFAQDYKDAMYETTSGDRGIPAYAFAHALVSACRLVDFKMTRAKLSLVVKGDGVDKHDGTSLVRIVGKPRQVIHHVRNATGVADLRVRAMWDKWIAKVRIEFDADQFSVQDVTNLMLRAGRQVGVGEGRPDSKESIGMGWGTFALKGV